MIVHQNITEIPLPFHWSIAKIGGDDINAKLSTSTALSHK